MTAKLDRFIREERPETPYLVVDLDVVRTSYEALAEALFDARIYYAVKANPAPEILRLLVGLGASFDVASLAETDAVLLAGADSASISFGNTIKKERDIAAAFERGVRLFAFDSAEELAKLGRAAPGARVFCRLLTTGEGAEWPLSRKFGCAPDMAFDLLAAAPRHDLVPWGLSFHVGSQQRQPAQWDGAIATAAELFRRLEEECSIELGLLNLGGGFPALYHEPVPAARAYGAAIRRSLMRHFGNRIPALIAEPGRGLVGDAGIIETEVVLIARKGDDDDRRWVYLDVGKFGGLAETMDEAIRYPILSDAEGPVSRVILAGPTCDSADVLYERSLYELPDALATGDRLRILGTGAYTTSYAAVNFNGFEPLRAYYV